MLVLIKALIHALTLALIHAQILVLINHLTHALIHVQMLVLINALTHVLNNHLFQMTREKKMIKKNKDN